MGRPGWCRFAAAAVLFMCLAWGAHGVCEPLASKVPWPALYGNAGFTAFQTSVGTPIGQCNWELQYPRTEVPWVPTFSGGGNLAMDNEGRVLVAMESTNDGPTTAAVAAVNATTGKALFLTPLAQHSGNVVVLVGAHNMVFVIGADAGASTTTDAAAANTTVRVTVLHSATGQVLQSATLVGVVSLTSGTPAALSVDGTKLFVVSSPQLSVFSVDASTLSVESVVRMESTFAGPCASSWSVPSWSAATVPGDVLVFEVHATSCYPTRLAVVDMQVCLFACCALSMSLA